LPVSPARSFARRSWWGPPWRSGLPRALSVDGFQRQADSRFRCHHRSPWAAA
jgi:hypothetical protein